MRSCTDLEPSLTSYVDGVCAAEERRSVEAHLEVCPPCRVRVTKERAAHEVLRTKCSDLRACAPADLRRRCAAQRAAAAVPPGFFNAGNLIRLSLAASVLLAAGVLVWFAFSTGVERFATTLAADHIKCFQIPPDAASVDANSVGAAWQAAYGWPLRVAASSNSDGLELLGTRRCASTGGLLAHVLYRWRGKPLSLYVLNRRLQGVHDASHGHHTVRSLGEQELIWSENGRTYALVAQASVGELEQLAQYVRRAVE